MTCPDLPPLAWLDFPAVRDFYRACCEGSITYLYAPHDEAMRTRIEFVDDPLRQPVTARQFANRHEVPEERVLCAAMVGTMCAGVRIRRLVGFRWRLRSGGWVCNSAGDRYRNCTEASESHGCHSSLIRQCAAGTIATAMGLRWWREVDGKRIEPAKQPPETKSPPIRYNGTRYPSIKHAVKQTGRTRRQVETRAVRLTA